MISGFFDRGEEAECCQNFKGRSSCMSVRDLSVCYFPLFASVHLKHISNGSFQYSQYCESEDFLFWHLHFITHVCTCASEEKKGVESRRGKIRSQIGYLPIKWSHVNKRGNGINISNVHSFRCHFGGETSSKRTIPLLLQDSLPLKV